MRIRPAALSIFALTLSLLAARVHAEPQALEGQAAPDVALKTLDGKSVKLSDMKGSVVVLDFWATWCPPCRESLPHLQSLSEDKERAKKGLVVWGVNAREKQPTIEKFMKSKNFTFSVPLDAAGASMGAYQVKGIPTTIVVGRDGKVAKAFVGYGGEKSAKALDAAIDTALAVK